MADILLDTVLDSIKILPFLFFTYLLMEFLEHNTGNKARERIRHAGQFGPLWGGLLGISAVFPPLPPACMQAG